MKTLVLLVGISLAVASPSMDKGGRPKFESRPTLEHEFFIPEKQYPEVITDFVDSADYSEFSMEELLQIASEHPGLEFLSDANATAAMGIDISTLSNDLVADAIATTCEFVKRRNYPCEIHRIQTSDRYILEMHRIPGSPTQPPREGKIPVYLQHGLLDSSGGWVIMGVQNSLAFILADLGYDVWMGNVRGNRYSREHLDHDPDGRRGDRRRFWDFSWHEMGTVDLPTMIDYITSVTGHQRMHYVGHSQGTTSFFVMCSMRPEYNNRILSGHMLAPIAFMGRLFSPFVRAAALFQNSIDFGASLLGIYEFLPNSDTMTRLGQAACRDEAFFQSMCSSVLFLIGGFNSAQLNGTMLPVILGHTPAGASTDQLVHYAQGIRSGNFRRFSFGAITNLIRYGSINAPRYNLSNIRAPLTLYYSLNDWLADPRDVRELFNGISSRRKLIQIQDPRFNHFDFLWAMNVRSQLYDQLITIMQEHD
ncbi:Lipase 3 [Pseudolycoriella hygida]|uniref:Lipase 3 n=1 Tax=Pseudolycoriella hygida TaxID=35572 RepID=A0A9Q0N072_9DIPT|nr:Lipase 3 [Pseudolycoriella hygida]